MRSAKMIDETEKPKIPSKFAKPAARYNEFGYKLIQKLLPADGLPREELRTQSKDSHYLYKNTKLEFCKEN